MLLKYRMKFSSSFHTYIDLFYSPFLFYVALISLVTVDAIFTLSYISTWTYGPLFVDYFLREEIFHCSTSVVGHGKRSLGKVSELTLALNQRFLVFFFYPFLRFLPLRLLFTKLITLPSIQFPQYNHTSIVTLLYVSRGQISRD